MNMQMLFTFYHMVSFQVMSLRGGLPLIMARGASENTVCQEAPRRESEPGRREGGESFFKATEVTNVLIYTLVNPIFFFN